MTIDIWSDIRCPFCYIGKTRLEQAIAEFEHGSEVTINWKAFELDPTIKTDLTVSTKEYLAQQKGMPLEQVDQMFAQVTQMAQAEGLVMDLEQSITANSFKAHQLSYYAQSKGLQNEVEEALFQAHFSNAINIDDVEELVKIGTQAGLEADKVREILETDAYTRAVEEDEAMARSIGVNSVPFFIVNQKYALKGAQSKDYFLETLREIYKEN